MCLKRLSCACACALFASAFAMNASGAFAAYSFSYGGKTYRDFEGVIDGTLKVSVVRGADETFAEREYTVWFENVSTKPSAELKDVVAYEGVLSGDRPLVRGILGDHDNFYKPYEHDLAKSPLDFENRSGRATHVTFPYFDVVHGENGTRLALGWAGTWRAEFSAGDDGVRVKLVSCPGFKGVLLPGERIRTGQVVRLDYPGRDESVGVNRWRAWFLKDVLPKADASGAPLKPFTTFGFMGDTGLPNSDGSISETYFTFPRTFAKLRHEGLLPDFRWLDAGWYADPAGKTVPSDWWGTVGSWEPDPVKWPKGTLRGTTDAGRAAGMKTLCWFEPERVTHVDDLVTNYGYRAEWSVDCNWPKTARTNNLGDPDCLAWTLGRIVKMMEENGIDFYREDNNSNQGESWQAVDAAETKKYGVPRVGFCENKFIQGHYALWDGILDHCRRHGKCTFVDSCASGGGRNDIESMRRGFPLMRSDYDRTTSGMRLSQTWGFCKWIPFHGSATKETKKQLEGMKGKAPDLYVTRASLLPIWNWGAKVTHDPDCDLAGYRRNIELWKDVKDLLLKDYYTLSPWSGPEDGSQWMALAYHDPIRDEAIALAFRREAATNDTFLLRLPFANPGTTYAVTDDDRPGASREMSGAALRAGFEVKLDKPRASALFRLRAAAGAGPVRFRFASWNIGHFSLGNQPSSSIGPGETAAKSAAYRRFLGETDADVVGVCEYSSAFCTDGTVRTEQAVFGDYGRRTVGTNAVWRWNAVFSKGFPVTDGASVPFTVDYPGLDKGLKGTAYTKSVLSIAGVRVVFAQVHLAWEERRLRRAQMEQLIRDLADEPRVVIAGDFNVGIDPVEGLAAYFKDRTKIVRLVKSGEFEIFRAAGYALGNDESFPTAPAGDLKYPLDNIVVRGLKMRDFRVIDRPDLSDHALVTAVLELEDGGQRPVRR